MKPTIPLLVVGLSLATFGGWFGVRAHAAEESKDITRVAIAVSGGPVAYTDQLRQDPPAIVIEFRSRNVIAALESSVVVNAGILKEIQSDYYPPGRRALKRLTLTLAQPAAYTIAQQANQIIVDVETPASVLPGRMAVGTGVTVLGIEAKETLIQRLKVMEGALQQAAPPLAPVSATPKPVVVTKPVEIPQSLPEPKPAPMPGPTKGFRGFWLGLLLGIGGSLIAVAGWRRRRKAAVSKPQLSTSSELPSMAQGASVLEQLVLKTVQRQGKTVVSSKAIAGLGTLWIIQKDDQRQGLVCLGDGGFLERKVLEQFVDALQQEALQSGSVLALGAFTAPAQTFAKEKEISLIPREEVFKLMEVELKSAAHVLDEETLKQQLVKPQSDLAQAQVQIKTLEQQVAELTQQLAAKDELSAKLAQEADQLKAKSADVDQRLAGEQEKRAHLEAQIAQLEEQLKAQPATIAGLPAAQAGSKEKAQLVQEATAAATDSLKEVPVIEEAKSAQEASQGQERRQWPRLDLSRHKGKGILVRATSNDGEPMNGDARNISAGGLCVELPSGERFADEFELKLFLPDRTKPIEAIGKIVWTGRGSRRRMQQLGIALSAINAPDQEAISQFVEERKPEPVTA